jgi:predicted enzyme related to lactoylglutathione lyase
VSVSGAGLSRLGTVAAQRLALVIDTTDPGPLASFWSEALGYTVTHTGDPYTVLAPASADRPELVLQRVEARGTDEQPVHLDLLVDDLEAGVERLERLGASVLSEHREYEDHRWRVMVDPQGNRFCVVAEVDR